MWGKDDASRGDSPFGSLPAATLSRYARIEPESKLLTFPRPEKYKAMCLKREIYATKLMVVGEG
ncbi:hypothetical protein N643_07820 [Salmonella bongori serovar 48:z41:-- str. RKS3044]|nr:hypothetical protein N643_07820 [Salmonella bongori serovar 48:z41:-- str. RKS3044]